MKLDRIVIKGFKSIKTLDLNLSNLNVLIGANGAGKSNFISLFRLFNDIIEGRLQESVGIAGGAEALLFFGHKATEKISIDLHFGPNRYYSEFVPTEDDTLIFKTEEIYYHNLQYPDPWNQIIGSGNKESNLSAEAKKRPGKVASHILGTLQNWKVYHFHDTSESARVKKWGPLNDNQYFRPDARNLAAFLFHLKENANQEYQLIRDTIRLVAPFFDDFLLRPKESNEGDLIRLEWKEKGADQPFLAHHLSDGTLRFICLTTLLLQPRKPSTIVIDEPELGLHPYAITMLSSLMQKTAQSYQLIVSTQSVPLLNRMNPDDLIIVDRHDSSSFFERLPSEQIGSWVEDYSLGDLWEKNILGGRP